MTFRSHAHRRLLPMRSLFLAVICITAAVVLLPEKLLAQSANQSLRPNILLIFSDDQGVNDVGCYGSEISTPHLDLLAKEGLKFNQFYAASSICTPSRFGLLTGRFAQRSHDQLTSALMFLADSDAKRGIRRDEHTYVSALHHAGYSTHLVGKWHLGHGDDAFWPTEHGFDTFYGHTGGCVDFFTCNYANRPDWYRGKTLVETTRYATDVITDEAVEIIRKASEMEDASKGSTPPTSSHRTPWYLHVAYNAPHFGKGWDQEKATPLNVMQPKPDDLKRVAEVEDPLRASFAAKVVGMDDGIGKILSTLRTTGQDQNTLVIFMTDHGGDERYGGSNLPLRGGKATLFEGGVRVPCLVRWPGIVKPGSETDSVASALDLFPTLITAAGIRSPEHELDGQSIMPILKGQSLTHRPIVWATGSHAELKRKAWFAVREGEWKWVSPPNEDAMLFDLATDPGEQKDVAALHPERCETMRRLALETTERN